MTFVLALLGVIGGALVGSFIATLVLRWPVGEQVVSGQSRCDGCGRPLRWFELIPLASALSSSGRCRTCAAPIASLHWQVEAIAALLAGSALLLEPNGRGLALALFWLLLLGPALLDLRHYWLPDRLTLALAAGGLLLGGFVSEVDLLGRLVSGLVGGLGLAAIAKLYATLRRRKGMGDGDPKFLAAIGLWLGWQALPFVLLTASLVGILTAVLLRRGGSERLPLGTLLAVAAVIWSALPPGLLGQILSS